MSVRCPRLVALCLAIPALAGVVAANASILTIIDPNCTGFALSGVAPNQSLACVGGTGSIASPQSLTIDDKFCGGYALTGTAPNQTLVCSVSLVPTLVSVASRKTHGSAGAMDLPLTLTPAGP